MKSRAAIALLTLAAVAAIATAILLKKPMATSPVQATTAAAYVGRASCAACHPREHERWLGSHHDLAMQEATEETVLGDFDDATFSHFGVTSSFFRRDGGFYVRTEGPDGELDEYRVTHTFGAVPLQQYLVAFPGGRYQVVGLCWDTRAAEEGGQKWFHIYPDEAVSHGDELHWTGPNQNWNFMCAACHSTNLRRGYDPERNAYETTWSEIDVSCEACHGPGSLHVEWAMAAATGAPYDDGSKGLLVRLKEPGGWVMNGQTGTAERTVPRGSRAQIETCAPCHSRRIQIHGEYVHGRPFLDTHRPRLLEDPLYFSDGQIRDEVYVYGSFVQSKMYSKGVTCSDCHEPHGLGLIAPGNALCARCHLPDKYDIADHHFHVPGTPGSHCVDCHMPARTYMVVDPRRDHSFRVPRPDLTVSLGTPYVCTGCHADQPAQWAADVIESRYGPRPPHFGEALASGRAGALAQLVSDHEQPAISRATALALLRDHRGSAPTAAVERGVRDEDALVRRAALEALLGAGTSERLRLAAPLLDDPVRAVRIAAARVLAPVPADALSAAQHEARDRAAAELVAAELVNAERPESHVNLGNFHVEQGRFTDADASYRAALRIDPDHIPAYVNLADLRRAEGRDDEGEAFLRRALEIDPDLAATHHALGLLLVRRDRLAEALDELERAAQLDPGNARFSYVYAVALDSAGRSPEALWELGNAHLRHPNDRDILSALVAFCRRTGDEELAMEYARKLEALER